jgi:tetratricopeptide (TPR) repeat protein
VGWLMALLVGVCSLLAAEKGTVTGTIDGPSNVPIAGARVTLAAADGSRQAVTTDQQGHYSFPSLEPATYTLSVEAAGYQPATRADVRVTGGTSMTVDFLLIATGVQPPNQAPSVSQEPSYYDDTPLKASGVKSTTDAAGYSSQAQSPRRLLTEGLSVTGNASSPQEPPSPEAAEAERGLREALRADPESFQKNHQLGEYYLSAANPAAGIPYLEKAKELRPGDASNDFDLARAYLAAKNPAKALPLLRDLIRRRDAAEYHDLLGQVDEALHDPASALREFELAAHMEPNEQNIFDWANEVLFVTDSNESGVLAFKQGVARFPNSVRMNIGLGIALYARNSYDAAIEALCHASDLDPSDPRPYVFLGKMTNVAQGNPDKVAKYMQRFMETNPNNALAYYYGALSLWKGPRSGEQGVDLARVEALFRKSLALDPRWAGAHLQLGILYHDQHREQDAISEFQAAIRSNPDDPDAHYRLAQAYFRAGGQERGQEELQLYEKLRKKQAGR